LLKRTNKTVTNNAKIPNKKFAEAKKRVPTQSSKQLKSTSNRKMPKKFAEAKGYQYKVPSSLKVPTKNYEKL